MREMHADTEMHGGVLGKTRLAKLLREAAGMSAADWLALEPGEAEEAWDRGAARLVEAAGVTETEFDRMRPFSPSRALVLLLGAAELGIATDWTGWE